MDKNHNISHIDIILLSEMFMEHIMELLGIIHNISIRSSLLPSWNLNVTFIYPFVCCLGSLPEDQTVSKYEVWAQMFGLDRKKMHYNDQEWPRNHQGTVYFDLDSPETPREISPSLKIMKNWGFCQCNQSF